MIRVNTKPRKRNAGRPCAADGQHCEGKVVAAHVDHAGDKGMATKVPDRHCIPLCHGHHTRQHNRGWTTFESEALGGKSAVAMADAYWQQWPGRFEWEQSNG